jgi:CheY-like chemotaxis protein
MINILIIEDDRMNIELLKIHIQYCFEQHNINTNIQIAKDGEIALDILISQDKVINLIFLDVMLPKLNGFEILTHIRKEYRQKQPYICMATSLGDNKYKKIYQQKGANAYLIKPYNKETMKSIIQKFIELKTLVDNNKLLDYTSTIKSQDSIKYKCDIPFKLSAKEFFVEYSQLLKYIIDIVNDSDEDLNNLISYLDGDSYTIHINTLSSVIREYLLFFNNFSDFQQVVYALNNFKDIILTIDINNFSEIHIIYIIEFIRGILTDLKNWKANVLDNQIAIDVFYINASIVNNCITLQELIKEEIKI